MNYRQISYSHSEFLSANLHGLYELSTGNNDCYYKTIPNGLIGLTILTGGGACYEENGRWQQVPRVSIYGLVKKPTLIRTLKNSRDISIGFNPLLMSRFLTLPMQLVSGSFTDAASVFPAHDLAELEDTLHKATHDNDLVKAIEAFLLKHFKASADAPLMAAYKGIASLRYSRVDELTKDLNMSSRTLLNKFRDKIGITPKELMKVYRINSALNLKVHNAQSLTSLAYTLGYFDQAHFIHEFKDTLGITPETYFKDKGLISDFYNYNRWSLL